MFAWDAGIFSPSPTRAQLSPERFLRAPHSRSDTRIAGCFDVGWVRVWRSGCWSPAATLCGETEAKIEMRIQRRKLIGGRTNRSCALVVLRPDGEAHQRRCERGFDRQVLHS
jgi:hypothetical protein